MVTRTFLWPVIALLVIGGTHFTAEAIWPKLQTIIGPTVEGPLLLAAGAWLGRNAVRAGGNFGVVIVSGLVLGLLPLVLQVVGFGMLLNRGAEAGQLAGTFGLLMVSWGALIGGGYSLSK